MPLFGQENVNYSPVSLFETKCTIVLSLHIPGAHIENLHIDLGP